MWRSSAPTWVSCERNCNWPHQELHIVASSWYLLSPGQSPQFLEEQKTFASSLACLSTPSDYTCLLGSHRTCSNSAVEEKRCREIRWKEKGNLTGNDHHIPHFPKIITLRSCGLEVQTVHQLKSENTEQILWSIKIVLGRNIKSNKQKHTKCLINISHINNNSDMETTLVFQVNAHSPMPLLCLCEQYHRLGTLWWVRAQQKFAGKQKIARGKL